jgi:IclR family transcriptional regulator, acetate operon repressor
MPRPRATAPPPPPTVLVKALAMLAAFDEHHPERSEAQLRRELALTRSTTNRIVRALEQYGYLSRTANGHYRLGAVAVDLGRRAQASFDLRLVARGSLEQLARATGETAVLAVRDGDATRCVDRVESDARLRVSLAVGATLPLHAGATSRALLAYLPDSEIETLLAGPLVRLASGTVTDAATLRRLIAETRRRGVASSREETHEGAWGVAAAIVNPAGGLVGVVGVIGPLMRLTPAKGDETAGAVRDAARRIGGA